MTREEFINRTNYNATADEYGFIKRVYMAAGDSIDKDQFCKDFNTLGITPTITSLTESVENSKATIEDLAHTIHKLAIFIAKQAEETSSAALRKKAIQLLGEREYITWKIESGKDLWQLDLNIIKNLINQ